jgi:hypothetical protein
VTHLAVGAGSASVLQSNLVTMGPTIVIVFGLVKWATPVPLIIGSRAALASIATDHRCLGLSLYMGNVAALNQAAELFSLRLSHIS